LNVTVVALGFIGTARRPCIVLEASGDGLVSGLLL
jgi:hypothetical protein